MAMRVRLIPRLDIKGTNLVKGIHLEGLRVLGKPEVFAETYYQAGADELLFADAVASLYGRNSLLDVIERTAGHIFIPLTVAGGIRSLDDIKRVLRSGADKVAINSAALADPDFITRSAERFGSSTIVVQIDAKRMADGCWQAFADNGRENSGRYVTDWALEAEQRGAGEIFLTSIDQEGTGHGYDIELVQSVASLVSVPLIASGGAGHIEDVTELLRQCNVEAVCVASLLHYAVAGELQEDGFSFDGGGEFPVIHERRNFDRIGPVSLQTLKNSLHDVGIESRAI